ncbi:phytanoyl-CoA dioxygenase family protein [Streptomyces platensis]|uniref:phytanoyl-CoA dioxygenase family protein n=1 Tax=Streptomyces platensis TaxID=58346 RepID=UPI002E257A3F|nr:phytanoyl-CoA dioxygenase family protein [Streptomyces platensis]WUB84569.1 phytanoyl-CoA dioxygenase family protein [Streptomyces platensis]
MFGSRQEIVERYQRDGFVVFPSLLPRPLLEEMQTALPDVLAEDGPQRFIEEDGSAVRAVYGLHRKPGVWRTVAESSVLAEIAQLLIGEDMYVFQWKINPKAAESGELWEWHRDFTFWARADGMPEPLALTAGVLLDDVMEENGPLQLIPGTQRVSTGFEDAQQMPSVHASEHQEANWASLVSTSLAHSVPDQVAEDVAGERGLVKVTGQAGTVVFFDSNILHGSAPNRSSSARTLGLISYNPVRNVAKDWEHSRPDFFVNHDAKPLDVPAFAG